MLMAPFWNVGSRLCSRDLTFAPSCFIIPPEFRKAIDLESAVTFSPPAPLCLGQLL